MKDHIEDDLYMVDGHFSRSGTMVWDNHFVGMHGMVEHASPLSFSVSTSHPLLCAEEEMLRVYAKRMRSNQTDAEAHLWQRLRAHRLCGLKFKRQKPIGRFIVDFVCHERSLVVEVDGGYHADTAQAESDQDRTSWLESQGFQVLRFWNHEVLGQTESVLKRILEAASAPSPSPPLLPQSGILSRWAGEGKGEGAQRQESNGGGV